MKDIKRTFYISIAMIVFLGSVDLIAIVLYSVALSYSSIDLQFELLRIATYIYPVHVFLMALYFSKIIQFVNRKANNQASVLSLVPASNQVKARERNERDLTMF